MFPGEVCYPGNLANHDSRKIDLLPPVQKISEALVRNVRKVMALSSGNDVLDNKPKKQLVKRSHFPFLDWPGSLQVKLLTQPLSQLKQLCCLKHSFVLPHINSKTFGGNAQNFPQFFSIEPQRLPIDHTWHHTIGDIAIGIKLCQVRNRTPSLGICKEFQPPLSLQFFQ